LNSDGDMRRIIPDADCGVESAADSGGAGGLSRPVILSVDN